MFIKALRKTVLCFLLFQFFSCSIGGESTSIDQNTISVPDMLGIENGIFLGSININEAKTIDNPVYSLRNEENYHNVEQLESKTTYIYEFIATSAFTSISTLENNSVEFDPNYKLDSFKLKILNKVDDYFIESVYIRDDMNGTTLLESIIGNKYYICVTPIETIRRGVTYKSDTIKFVVDEYKDQNNSPDTAETINVGQKYHGFFPGSDTEYFKVNLTAGKEYILDLESYYTEVTLTTISGESIQIIGMSSGDDRFIATATGDYVLALSHDDPNFSGVEPYWFSIIDYDSVPTIQPSSMWNDDVKEMMASNYYKVNIDPSKEYIVSWKDKYYEDVNYTGSFGVTFYEMFNTNRGTSIFSRRYETDHEYLDFQSSVSYLLLRVKGWGTNGIGNYSFKVEENTAMPSYTTIPVGTFVECDTSDGYTQFFKFNIDRSKKYILQHKIPYQNDGYDAHLDLSLYTPDKSEYFFRNRSYTLDKIITFTDTTSTNNELIFRLRFAHGTKSGFELVEYIETP